MVLDPDLVDHRLTWISLWIELVWHYPVPLLDAHNSLCHSFMYKSLAAVRCCRTDTEVLFGVLLWGVIERVEVLKLWLYRSFAGSS